MNHADIRAAGIHGASSEDTWIAHIRQQTHELQLCRVAMEELRKQCTRTAELALQALTEAQRILESVQHGAVTVTSDPLSEEELGF